MIIAKQGKMLRWVLLRSSSLLVLTHGHQNIGTGQAKNQRNQNQRLKEKNVDCNVFFSSLIKVQLRLFHKRSPNSTILSPTWTESAKIIFLDIELNFNFHEKLSLYSQ